MIVVLALLVLGAGGIGLYVMSHKGAGSRAAPGVPATQPEPTTPPLSPEPTPAAVPGDNGAVSRDALNAKTGDCLVNDGTNEVPTMRKVTCAKDTFEVVKRLPATIDKDKCNGVPGYTHNYFFDSPVDANDFVLCLKQRK
jgi:hypothetical protein